MASIRQRRTGWSVLWREAGQQRSRLFPTLSAAEQFLHQVEAGASDTVRSTACTLSLRAYAERHWLPRARLAEGTKRAYRSSLNQVPSIADRPIAWVAVHTAEVEDAIAASARADHSNIYAAVKGAMRLGPRLVRFSQAAIDAWAESRALNKAGE